MSRIPHGLRPRFLLPVSSQIKPTALKVAFEPEIRHGKMIESSVFC